MAEPLTDQIEAAVRAVPGVTDVYRAGSGAASAVARGARALGGASAPRVRVEDGLVDIAIGVDARDASRGVARRVCERVRDAVGDDREIRVTVVRVEQRSTPAR